MYYRVFQRKTWCFELLVWLGIWIISFRSQFKFFLFNIHSWAMNMYLTWRQPLRSLLNRLNIFSKTFRSCSSKLSWKVYGTLPSGHFLENRVPFRAPIIWPMVNSISPFNTISVSSSSLSKMYRTFLGINVQCYSYFYTPQ